MQDKVTEKRFDAYCTKNKPEDHIVRFSIPYEDCFSIAVKTSLPPEEIAAFVSRVVENSYDRQTGQFVAAYRDIFFKITALQFLTNSPIPEEDGNINIVKAVEYADRIDLTGGNRYHGHFIRYLERLVDQQIEYEKSARIAQMSATTEKAISRFMAVCDKLEAALGHFSAANSEKALAAIQSLADKGITPKGIIDAFMDNKFAAEAPAE